MRLEGGRARQPIPQLLPPGGGRRRPRDAPGRPPARRSSTRARSLKYRALRPRSNRLRARARSRRRTRCGLRAAEAARVCSSFRRPRPDSQVRRLARRFAMHRSALVAESLNQPSHLPVSLAALPGKRNFALLFRTLITCGLPDRSAWPHALRLHEQSAAHGHKP